MGLTNNSWVYAIPTILDIADTVSTNSGEVALISQSP